MVFVLFLTAVRAQVTSRKKVGASREWIRYGINVATVYKHPNNWPSRFQPDAVWVPTMDVTCRCPKLRRRRTYLLVGQTSTDVPAGSGGSRTLPKLVVDRESVAMRWNDAWSRKMKRFARSQRC